MKKLLKYLLPFRKRMAIGLSIKISGTFIELALPYILSYILKTVVAKESIKEIVFWGAVMALCALTGCICNICANRMAARVSRNFSESIRRDLFSKTLLLSAKQTDDFTVPSLESRITTDTYNVHHFIGMIQRMGVRAPTLLIGGIIITLIMDRFLALVMIAVLPFIFVTVYFISKNGVPLYTKVQGSVDNMVRIVREDAQGIRVIKALSKTEYEKSRFDIANRRLSGDEKRAGIIMGSVNPIMSFLMNAGIVAVIAISASRIASGLSDVETVIAFIQYFTLISMAMMSVTRIFVMYTKSAASAKRIAQVLEAGDDITVHSENEYPCKSTNCHVLFDNVDFSYVGKQNDVQNISVGIKKGGTLGIIGATGSGKTTLIKLLLRFYDVDGGAIYIDGKDVRTMEPQKLYGLFGSAMQQDFLYGDTIYENIDFGRNLPKEQIEWAAKVAQAESFISEFDDGYMHILSQKGTNISGGQKQRILIARAIAAKPQILILDDSSSALDYKTDANLRLALKENLKDTTVITVAQRVSSIKDCDVIIVMDGGKITGIGNHRELIESCPQYSEIHSSQMGGAFVE